MWVSSYGGPLGVSVCLSARGLGITSTVASLVLLVVPSFSPGWSRWWALAPTLAYVIGALLWAEYKRVSDGCLSATLISEKDDRWTRRYLEICNCGVVLMRDIDWELRGGGSGMAPGR